MSRPFDADDRRRRLLVAAAAGLIALIGIAVPGIVFLVSRTSSASFADTEVLSTNRLGAATLDIEIEANPNRPVGQDGEPVVPGSQSAGEALFTATNLAPGDVVTGQLEMTNTGDVPLRYGLLAVGDGGQLLPWVRFEVWAGTGVCEPNQPGPRVIEDVAAGTEPVALVELYRVDGANILQPGQSFRWCIGATLALETPNEAQSQRLDLTLIVPAEQVPEEGS